MISPDRTDGGIAFVKGHGTENDFVLLPDPDGSLTVSATQVRALCDRRAGIGADGVIRVAPGSATSFVMDYYNADGSPAQMCGNGARLFARFLVDAGWSPPGRVHFQTMGGLRTADVPESGDVTIDLGPVRLGPSSDARVAALSFPGVAVDVGNPHLVCVTNVGLATLDLAEQPWFDPEQFPEGVNIEFVSVLDTDRVAMRVHERGVGETRSCGTGTVAAAAVYLHSTGRDAGSVTVQVPGGTVRVRIDATGSTLTGPAVIVASGEINPAFWRQHR